jgi:HEAT repeat protein
MQSHRWLFCFVSLALVACNEPTHQGRYLSSWIRDLDSSQDYKRRQACEAIAEMGPAAAAAVPELIELLDDVNPGVQEFARDALANMGPGAIAELMPLLAREEPAMRLHATIAILEIDPKHEAAQTELVRFVTSLGNLALSTAAHEQAVAIGAPIVPKLLPFLDDSYAPVRLQILETLRSMKSAGVSALPKLIEMTASETKPELRKTLVFTLANVGTREQIEPTLRELLKDEALAISANDMLIHIGAVERPTTTEVKEAAARATRPEPPKIPLRSLLSEP